MARKKYSGTIVPGVEPGKGLVCRACGCQQFFVVYTRPAPEGRIFRRRECRHCGKRLTTVERQKKTAENAEN